MKKKVAHLISTDFYGGPEKQIIEHIRTLKKSDYSGIVISFIEGNTKNEFLEQADKNNIPHYGIETSQLLDLRIIYNLVKYIKKNAINLLCAHGYKSTVLGFLLKNITGLPVIGFSRGFTSENRKVAFYEMLDRRALKHLDGIVSVSLGQKIKLKKYGVSHNKSWVVYNAVNTNNHHSGNNIDTEIKYRICKELQLPSGSRFIVTAGRLSPEKGHIYLVNAIPLVLSKYPEVHFIFCGDGECKNQLEKRASQLNIQKNCHFIGFRRDLPDIFRIMEFQVLPSLTEGLPNVVLEGFSNSRTVVATAVGGVPEIVSDKKNGILVPPGDSKSLESAILALLQNPNMSIHMGRVGYNIVRRNFTFEKQSKKLMEIYQKILSE
jgi:glycosyltransferase involved in cell wall biosynthesis